MKVELKEKGFQPIKLKITIESEEELCSLWHRMNVNSKNIDIHSQDTLKYKSCTGIFLYEKLNYLVKKHNLKKE